MHWLQGLFRYQTTGITEILPPKQRIFYFGNEMQRFAKPQFAGVAMTPVFCLFFPDYSFPFQFLITLLQITIKFGCYNRAVRT